MPRLRTRTPARVRVWMPERVPQPGQPLLGALAQQVQVQRRQLMEHLPLEPPAAQTYRLVALSGRRLYYEVPLLLPARVQMAQAQRAREPAQQVQPVREQAWAQVQVQQVRLSQLRVEQAQQVRVQPAQRVRQAVSELIQTSARMKKIA